MEYEVFKIGQGKYALLNENLKIILSNIYIILKFSFCGPGSLLEIDSNP